MMAYVRTFLTRLVVPVALLLVAGAATATAALAAGPSRYYVTPLHGAATESVWWGLLAGVVTVVAIGVYAWLAGRRTPAARADTTTAGVTDLPSAGEKPSERKAA